MDNRVVLVKALNVAYLSNQMGGVVSDTYAELVDSALDMVPKSAGGLGVGLEGEMIDGLVTLISAVARPDSAHIYGSEKIVNDCRVICRADLDLVDDIEAILGSDSAELKDKKERLFIETQALRSMVNSADVSEAFRIAYRHINTGGLLKGEHRGFVREFIETLEGLDLGDGKSDPSVLSEITFKKDDVTLLSTLDKVKEQSDDRFVWKLGWQGVNDMFDGGFRPGDFITCWGLQHKYKTGAALSIFRQLATYNSPSLFQRDPGMLPTIIRFSFEDKDTNDVRFLFEQAYISEHGKMPDISKFTKEQMAEYISAGMTKTGWTVKTVKVRGDDWGYHDVVNFIDQLEADGHEVHAVVFDYLGLVTTFGCDRTGPTGTDIRSLFRKIRAYFAGKDIVCFTPGQLGPDARALFNTGVVPPEEYLPSIKGRGMFSGSKQLDQESDINMYVHIVPTKDNGTYLHILSDKHRHPVEVAEQRKSIFYRFPERGHIPDDITGEAMHTLRLPRGSISGNEYSSDTNDIDLSNNSMASLFGT